MPFFISFHFHPLKRCLWFERSAWLTDWLLLVLLLFRKMSLGLAQSREGSVMGQDTARAGGCSTHYSD